MILLWKKCQKKNEILPNSTHNPQFWTKDKEENQSWENWEKLNWSEFMDCNEYSSIHLDRA